MKFGPDRGISEGTVEPSGGESVTFALRLVIRSAQRAQHYQVGTPLEIWP